MRFSRFHLIGQLQAILQNYRKQSNTWAFLGTSALMLTAKTAITFVHSSSPRHWLLSIRQVTSRISYRSTASRNVSSSHLQCRPLRLWSSVTSHSTRALSLSRVKVDMTTLMRSSRSRPQSEVPSSSKPAQISSNAYCLPSKRSLRGKMIASSSSILRKKRWCLCLSPKDSPSSPKTNSWRLRTLIVQWL